MADSWLTDGNCSECRRNKYCNKKCKKRVQVEKRREYSTAMETTGMERLLYRMGMSDTAEDIAKVIGLL